MAHENNFSITRTVKQFGAKLYSFIRGRVNTNEDAEDILQDVWFQFSNLTNIEDIENAGAWLYRVARNKVTDKYRKKTTDLIDDHTYEDEEGEASFKEILLLDDTNNLELAIFKDYFWEKLMDALDELPEKQKEVFVLNELEDLTLQEIADASNENIKTIISRKGYAVKHLRNRLNYLYEELNF